MQPPFPSPVDTWRNDTYDAINPKRPELSVAGKTVVITGAGTGIGRETALAFASAGAAHVALLGRTEQTLAEVAQAVASQSPASKASIHVVDVSDGIKMPQVAEAIGTWDMLVNAAGTMPTPGTIATANVADYWRTFETNAKGTFVVLHSFVGTANKEHAVVCSVVSATPPVAMMPGFSAYSASKLAQTRIGETFAAENPNIITFNVNPGMIQSAMWEKSGADASIMPMDAVRLPAHFMVWLSHPDAAVFRGRTLYANWDVTDLKAIAGGLEGKQDWTSGVHGWPFAP